MPKTGGKMYYFFRHKALGWVFRWMAISVAIRDQLAKLISLKVSLKKKLQKTHLGLILNGFLVFHVCVNFFKF